jgi:hypothetical protein
MYDYKAPAVRGPADLRSSPNPILDCPTGLMLLFDELWFLSRSLCPQNLRGLPWVKFLDEAKMLPNLSDMNALNFSIDWERRPDLQERHRKVLEIFPQYDWVRHDLGVWWEKGQDNHTHSLNIAGLETSANSARVDNILMDLEILKRLANPQVELATNRFGKNWLEATNPTLQESALAQVLVIDRIPSYLNPDGPYHPVMEEARDNSFLKDFRRWISESAVSTGLWPF